MPMPPGDIEGHGDTVLLVGETMERWTNGQIKSVMYQASSHFSDTGRTLSVQSDIPGPFLQSQTLTVLLRLLLSLLPRVCLHVMKI